MIISAYFVIMGQFRKVGEKQQNYPIELDLVSTEKTNINRQLIYLENKNVP